MLGNPSLLTLSYTEQPDAVNNDRHAAVILWDGVVCGVFTGSELKNFIGNPLLRQIVDDVHAHTIIDGMDQAGLIEGCGKPFATALNKAGVTTGFKP